MKTVVFMATMIFGWPEAFAGWSPEWTNGVQTNALYEPEGRHYRELAAAINERAIAARFSQSDFWNEGTSRPTNVGPWNGRWNPWPAHRPELLDLSQYSTNAFWTPTATEMGALVEKVVELSRYFARTNYDISDLELPLSALVGDNFDSSTPRWQYEMAERMQLAGTNWNAMTNTPIFPSRSPGSYFGLISIGATGSNERVHALRLPIHGNATGAPIVIATQTLAVARFVPDATGTNAATINVAVAPEPGAWEYDHIQIRLDPPDFGREIPYALKIICADTNAAKLPAAGCGDLALAPDNARNGSNLTNCFRVASNLVYGTLGAAPTNIGMKYAVSALFDPLISGTNGAGEFPLAAVAEYINLKAYGAGGSPLRSGWSDWKLTWPEMVFLRTALSKMKCVPATLAAERIGRSESFAQIETNGAYSSCGDLPTEPEPSTTNHVDERGAGTVWDFAAGAWTNGASNSIGNIVGDFNLVNHEGDSGADLYTVARSRRAYVDGADCAGGTADVAVASATLEPYFYNWCVKVPEEYFVMRSQPTAKPAVERVLFWTAISEETFDGATHAFSYPPYGTRYETPEEWARGSATNETIIRDESGAVKHFMRLGEIGETEELAQEAFYEISGAANCHASTNWCESYGEGDPVLSSGEGWGFNYNHRRMSATALIYFDYEYP